MIAEIHDGKYDDADDAIVCLKEVARAFADETIYDISDEQMIETLKGIICRLANQGRTIIVGRSAGVILKDVPNKLNIRLEAPSEWRINRTSTKQIPSVTHSSRRLSVVKHRTTTLM